MKKTICFLISIILIVGLVMPCACALFDSGTVTSSLLSDIYYMENLDEGTVFFEKDSNEKTPAAGFIKIIAAIVAIEKWGNLDGEIKVTEKNLNLFDYEDGMTTALYEEGEVISKRELFDCLVAYSANDALSIIGYEVAGSLENLVSEMQSLVTKIGCTSTVVKNIHGFDEEGQYTTAADVAKIIKYALQYPAFAEAFATDEVVLKETEHNEERVYQSSNKMRNAAIADYYHSSVTGGKQTSTDLAGECIAVVSNSDGYSYLTVVMGGYYDDIDEDYYDENTCMTDAQMMLDWVYENIRYRVIASPTQAVATVDVVAGQETDKLRLVPEKETSALVPSHATPASVMFEFVEGTKPESVVAPIKAGEVLASANVYYAGQKLTTINLVAEQEVKLSFGGLVLSGMKKVVGSTFVLIVTFIAAFIAVLRFALDLKDFFDKERKKSYDPLPSSFEQLVEKIKSIFSPTKDKKSKNTKKAPEKKPQQKKRPAGNGTPKNKSKKPEPPKAKKVGKGQPTDAKKRNPSGKKPPEGRKNPPKSAKK